MSNLIAQDAIYQKYNESIFSASNGKIYFSSIDGLCEYNGQQVTVHDVSNSLMTNNLIVGNIFSSDSVPLWFTSNDGLYNLNMSTQDIVKTELIIGRDTVKSDYQLLSGRSEIIVLKVKDKLVYYNHITKQIVKSFELNLMNMLYPVLAYVEKDSFVVCLEDQRLTLIQFGFNVLNFQSKILDSAVLSHAVVGHNIYYVNAQNQVVRYSLVDGTVWPLLSINRPILAVQNLHSQLVLVTDDSLIFVNSETHELKSTLKLSDAFHVQKNSVPIRFYMSPDSILWVGFKGLGIRSYNMGQRHFELYSYHGDLPLKKLKNIVGWEDERLYFIANDNIYQLVDDELSCAHLPVDNGSYISAAKFKSELVLSTGYEIQSFNPITNKLTNRYADGNFFDCLKVDIHGNLIFTNYSNKLFRISASSTDWQPVQIAACPVSRPDRMYARFDIDKINHLFVSNNEVEILVFDSSHQNVLNILDISGGVNSLVDLDSTILIANYTGLYEIKRDDWTFTKILDIDGRSTQQFYSVMVDKLGYYWLSSNRGILRYDPRSHHTHRFKLKDGLQGYEYQSYSYFQNSRGIMYFGGVDGLNCIDPQHVMLSTKNAPILFYNYKLNDVDSDLFGYSNQVDQFDLYHYNNTISFEFVGIDHSGIEYVNLRYQMDGYDDHWVELNENNGLARYANLPYGEYTFQMMASNSDEVWSDELKSVEVVVHPPFYATKWFQILSGIFILCVIYSFVRRYFRRKLVARDQLLKHQALIIEKQEAVEYERHRIAGEMHDDLGAGLTSIKYLSEKALDQNQDVTEQNNIRRIVDHANTLVTNMSEIIWAMNGRYDGLVDLVAYIRRYASNYLSEHGKTMQFEIHNLDQSWTVGGESRRNIFLVIKECLHNFVKYANTDKIEIDISFHAETLNISILEMGNEGFDINLLKNQGNGLHNMSKRMNSIGGKLIQEKSERGWLTRIIYSKKENTV